MAKPVANPGQSGKHGKTEGRAQKASGASDRVSKSTNTKRRSSQPQASVSKAKKEAMNEPTEDPRWEEVHRHCLDIMDEVDKESYNLNATIDKERHETSKSIQKLRTELQQVTATVHQATGDKERAERRCGELEKEVTRMRQQNEASITSSQDQVPWTEVQSMLQGIHTNILATAHGVFEKKTMLENRQFSTFLPGSDVFQVQPLSQTAPSTAMGSYALPGGPLTLPVTGWFGNEPIPTQPNMSNAALQGA